MLFNDMRFSPAGFVILLLSLGSFRASNAQVAFDRLGKVTIAVNEPREAHAFYNEMLGLSEQPLPDGGLAFRLNPEQELRFLPSPAPDFRFVSIDLVTKHLAKLRQTLIGRGIDISPVSRTAEHDLYATFKDPSGNTIGLRQPGVTRSANPGHPRQQVTDHLLHAGLAEDSPEALPFFRDRLGFREMQRGGPVNNETYWINMAIPSDQQDYVELMIHASDPASRRYHLCFEVPDIHAAYAKLVRRGMPSDVKPFVAQNHRWAINYRDPFGIRIEIMGEHTDLPTARAQRRKTSP